MTNTGRSKPAAACNEDPAEDWRRIGTAALHANWAIENLLKEARGHLKARDMARVEHLCRDALAAEPAASDAWHLLAIALAERNCLADAARAAQHATELLPSNASYWIARGMIALDQDLPSDAQASFRIALKLNPKLFEAHYLLGRSYHRTDRFGDAISSYRKAMREAPERPEIHFHLARALLATDRVQEALTAFQRAFVADPEERLDRRQCLECFRRLPLKALPTFWQTELARFFDRLDIDKSRYVMVGLYALMSKPAFRVLLGVSEQRQAGKPDLDALDEVMNDPLFGTLLRDAVVGHPQFERMLTRLRCTLLFDDVLRARAPLRFLCDLALQCFNNEFVYAENATETAMVDQLSRAMHEVLEGRPHADEQFLRSLFTFAMYRPLHTLASIETLLAETYTEAVGLLLHRTVVDVFEEKRLRCGIRRVGQITDTVSQRVRAQYEENPYPRWLAFDRDPKIEVSEWIRSELPNLSLPVAVSATMNILVAGCGTGVEAVSLAAKVEGIRVTAVDLSLSSLTYAKRKANELGLENIEFVQADILELAELQQRFDAVLCVGVLHHMREPRAGLRALVPLVRPDGLLKIGLYSERARGSVNVARKMISGRQLVATEATIRAIRTEVLAVTPASPLAGMLRWIDFFTMSGCRDLLFHVQEHQFTLPQVARLLRSENLTILGVTKHLPRQAVRAYRRLAPDDVAMADLGKWEAVETLHPGAFEDMYVIWCRRA